MAKKKTSTQIRSEAMKRSWAERRNSPMREQARKRSNELGDKVSRQDLKSKPKGEPKFWILWGPLSEKPPRVKFGTLDHVQKVADIMVEKYHQPYYIMESVQKHAFGKPEVVKYDGPPAKEPVAEPAPRLQPPGLTVTNQKRCPLKHFEEFNVMERIPPPLSMQGQPWDRAQDEKLIRLWINGARDIRILAERMGRSELAIEYRLSTLGVLCAEKP